MRPLLQDAYKRWRVAALSLWFFLHQSVFADECQADQTTVGVVLHL